jgi:hypothetical protein
LHTKKSCCIQMSSRYNNQTRSKRHMVTNEWGGGD